PRPPRRQLRRRPRHSQGRVHRRLHLLRRRNPGPIARSRQPTPRGARGRHRRRPLQTRPRRDRTRVAQHTKPYDNVLETIGWTPLIRLNKVTRGIRTPVYVKAEFFNPGGSVKDRIGLAMIEAAERAGKLKPGGLIVEA